MLLNRFKIIILCLFAMASPALYSQSVGFMDSEAIRQEFQEAELAEQRIQTKVDEWKLEINAMQEQINKLEHDISKNRLVWSEEELQKNEADLEKLVNMKSDYNWEKFRPGGEFDNTVKLIQEPIEAKIYDEIQQKSIEEKCQMLEENGK